MGDKREISENEIKKDTPVDDSNDNEKENQENSTDELTKCKDELETLNDKYLRAHADFENMRKRLEREKSNAVIFANETFATDLLAVLDSFDSAIASMEQIEGDEVVDKIKEGVLLTYSQMKKVLNKHGVEEIANSGQFDPNFHQVVQQVDSNEHEKDEIVNTLQKGYKLKDRVLRPSIVVTKK